MSINKNNYEAYFLDAVEGDLNSTEQQELDLFLSQNPDLKAELEEFEMLELNAETITNETLKSSLFREESTGLTEEEYLLIADLEGNISSDEKHKLNSLIAANPKLKKEQGLFAKTRLSNQEKVVFPNKSALIKKKGKLVYFIRYASAAAAAILAFIWFNTGQVDEQYNPRTANIETENIGEEKLQFANIIIEEEEEQEPEVSSPNVVEPAYNYEEPSYAEQVPEPKKEELETKDKPLEKLEKKDDPAIAIPNDDIAEAPKVKTPETESKENMGEAIADNSTLDNKKEFVPLDEFAKKAILKDKSVSEFISEEIASISNDKINYESVKNKQGKTQQFALNIGKLKISRK